MCFTESYPNRQLCTFTYMSMVRTFYSFNLFLSSRYGLSQQAPKGGTVPVFSLHGWLQWSRLHSMRIQSLQELYIVGQLEYATRERKVLLKNVTSEMQMMENTMSTCAKFKSSLQQSRNMSERDAKEIDEVFAALVTSLQRWQGDLIKLIQGKQKEAETKAGDHVTQLEQEAADLRRQTWNRQLLHTDYCLHLLQNSPSLHLLAHIKLFNPPPDSIPPYTKDISDISEPISAEFVKKITCPESEDSQ